MADQPNHAEDYSEAFSILSLAAVGVVLTRSREPFRAIETLRAHAFTEGSAFKVWTITKGWATYERQNPEGEPVIETIQDPLAALRAIDDLNSPVGQSEKAVYVMMYPHAFINRSPGLLQTLKEYARFFTEGKKRLVLLTTHGYSLPMELEDDIVILDYDTPSHSELMVFLDNALTPVPKAKRPKFTEEENRTLCNIGAGMTAQEFENAISRALITHRANLPNVPVEGFAEILMKVKTEVVKRSEVLELMAAEEMSAVGGLQNLKAWLQKRKSAFTEEARDFGIDMPKGIALIGPPGTGKTLMAKATASALGLPLIKFDISRIFKSLVGESEARVRSALQMVDSMAPCVLFVDEIDKALSGAHGSTGDSGVSSRVLGTLLTWMQESKSPVFAVVTANRVNNLPAEFLRRGRLDEVFSVTTPVAEERMEALEIHLRKRGHDPADVANLQVAVDKSEGYVPSEIESAVVDALIDAFFEGGKEHLTGELIAKQLETMTPLSVAFADDFQLMETWARNNARSASSYGESQQKVPAIRTRRRSGGHRPLSIDG